VEDTRSSGAHHIL